MEWRWIAGIRWTFENFDVVCVRVCVCGVCTVNLNVELDRYVNMWYLFREIS